MEPTSLTVTITQELIDEGCHDSENCPMAKAFLKSFLEWAGLPTDKEYRHNIRSEDGTVIGAWGVGVGVGTSGLHMYVYDPHFSDTLVGFEFHHAKVTDRWVERYDQLQNSYVLGTRAEPISFEVPITDDMRKTRDAFRKYAALSSNAQDNDASPPSD